MSTEIKTNAQLRLNQIISHPNRKKKSYQVSGHIGEVKIFNFSDGTKIVEFDSKDGEISFTIVTNEPFQLATQNPPLTFIDPEARELFPVLAVPFKAYLRCKKPSKACVDCQFLSQCQGINESRLKNNPKEGEKE